MRRSRLLTLCAAAALTSPLTAAQAIVDRQDVELALHNGHHPGYHGRVMDMAYTVNDYLIVVFAEYAPGVTSDRIVVMQRDPNGVWTQLSAHAYGFDHILDLSIAIPQQGDGTDSARDRVYIAAQFASDVGAPDDPHRPGPEEIEHVALVSGPWLTPWRNPGRLAFVDAGQPQVPPRWRNDFNPGVVCVPTGSSATGDYAVELVFAYPVGTWGDRMEVYRAHSDDYGRNVQPAERITGPNATGTNDPVLKTDEFRQPSIAVDWRHHRVLIAMEDRTDDVVRVVGGWPTYATVDLVGSSDGLLSGSRRLDRNPMIAADDGTYALTYLRRSLPHGGGPWALALASGVSITPGFVDRGVVHSYAASPGDIELRNGDVYVAARLFLDNVFPQTPTLMAWEGRFNASSGGTFTAVGDFASRCQKPRVAVTFGGEPRGSVGYGDRDWDSQRPSQMASGAIYVNE